MENESFYSKKIREIKVSDAKLFLIKLQQDGKRHSTVKTIRGVLRPAFQMAMDDDILVKNPFNGKASRNRTCSEQFNLKNSWGTWPIPSALFSLSPSMDFGPGLW